MKIKQKRKVLFVKMKPYINKKRIYIIEDPVEYILPWKTTYFSDYHLPPHFGFETNTILNNILPYSTLDSLETTNILKCKHRVQNCLNKKVFKKHYISLGCSGYYSPSVIFFMHKKSHKILAIQYFNFKLNPFEMLFNGKRLKTISQAKPKAKKKKKQRIYQDEIKITHLNSIEEMLKKYAQIPEKITDWQEKINIHLSILEKQSLEKNIEIKKCSKKIKI